MSRLTRHVARLLRGNMSDKVSPSSWPSTTRSNTSSQVECSVLLHDALRDHYNLLTYSLECLPNRSASPSPSLTSESEDERMSTSSLSSEELDYSVSPLLPCFPNDTQLHNIPSSTLPARTPTPFYSKDPLEPLGRNNSSLTEGNSHVLEGSTLGLSRKERRKLFRNRKRRQRRILPATKAKRLDRRQAHSQAKLALRQELQRNRVQTRLEISSMSTSRHAHTGACAEDPELERLGFDIPYRNELLESCILVPYRHNCQAPTHIIDGNGFKFGLRSFRHQSVTPGFVEALLRRIDDFAYACKITPPKTAHQRGNFAQILLGKSHGRGAGENYPYPISFDSEHYKASQTLKNSHEIRFIVEHLVELMETHIPQIAALFKRCKMFWAQKSKEYTMEFGLFFTLAINAPIERHVETIPHRDSLNLAFGVCAIFVYGFFDDGECAWLVNLEAGIIVQIPVGVFYLFPSALITHFNVNIHKSSHPDLELVTTTGWELPTSLNTQPLRKISSGRGSLVFYNQGSFFNWMLTGHRLMKDAVQALGAQRVRDIMREEAHTIMQ